MLEDPGGFLDETPTIFRRRLQDRVELTLADDDVHLSADTGVGEEFLDVEKSARRAVDGVLGAAIAKERARDRDLGVVDGKRAIGVIDCQRHLGAAQRCAARRTGKDDIRHGATTEGLGTLLAHDPRQCIDDVGLAGAIGSDDARDPGFEGKGRGGRKRLEALESQALQVHALSPPDGTART